MLLYLRVCLAALLILFGSSCAGQLGPDEAPSPRAPNGVEGKTLIETSAGSALATQLVVIFEPDITSDAARQLIADFGGSVVWRGPRSGAFVAVFADAAAANRALAELPYRASVLDVERDLIVSGTGISTSPGPVELQWNLRALELNPARGWQGAAGVRVAVLDTGAAYEDFSDASGNYSIAPDLAALTFVRGYDFVNDDGHANDDEGHGTHMTGIIAATGEDGIVAVAPGVEIIPVKVLDDGKRGTELALAEGIYFAVDNGADIINMSLSFSPRFFPSRFLQRAVGYAAAHGVIMVSAVGNHGSDFVPFPAAFRDVIAVTASQLDDSFRPRRRDPWKRSNRHLEPTTYANRGYAVDISAPGGRIDSDIDGDGNPEAILAQTFSGDPNQFDYFFLAGTSPAAAEVTGLAAVALGRNRSLSPELLREQLGRTARKLDGELLDPEAGRGFARGKRLLRRGRADQRRVESGEDRDDDDEERDDEDAGEDSNHPRLRNYFAATAIVMRDLDGERVAEATIEVTNQRGAPVRRATVYGTFTGNVLARVQGRTNRRGIVTFRSPPLQEEAVLAAFQVDAVARGRRLVRPRGFLRIDSCSLDVLAQFTTGSGISTSPGPVTLQYDNAPRGGVPSVVLLNYGWSGSLTPMAVVVEASWYSRAFPRAELRTVRSFGSGISTSPIDIDPQRSFDPRVLASWQPELPGEQCVPLVVRTYANAAPETYSPIIADRIGGCSNARCRDIDRQLLAMWQSWGAGISTSPLWDPSSGLSHSLFDYMAALVQSYGDFGLGQSAVAVSQFGRLLRAAGIGLTPANVSLPTGVGLRPMN